MDFFQVSTEVSPRIFLRSCRGIPPRVSPAIFLVIFSVILPDVFFSGDFQEFIPEFLPEFFLVQRGGSSRIFASKLLRNFCEISFEVSLEIPSSVAPGMSLKVFQNLFWTFYQHFSRGSFRILFESSIGEMVNISSRVFTVVSFRVGSLGFSTQLFSRFLVMILLRFFLEMLPALRLV